MYTVGEEICKFLEYKQIWNSRETPLQVATPMIVFVLLMLISDETMLKSRSYSKQP